MNNRIRQLAIKNLPPCLSFCLSSASQLRFHSHLCALRCASTHRYAAPALFYLHTSMYELKTNKNPAPSGGLFIASYLIILVLFSLLTGCIPKNSPPTDIYTISPEWNNKNVQIEPEKKSPLTIKLSPIRATQALISNEILYTDSQDSQDSYFYSRWNDTPVKLLQTLFLVNIEESGLFKAVVPPTSVSKTDLLMESTLLDLSHHINGDGTSEGIIRIRFYLIDNKTRTVIETKKFVSKVQASTQNAKGAVRALNKAATNVAHELVIWLAEPDRF